MKETMQKRLTQSPHWLRHPRNMKRVIGVDEECDAGTEVGFVIGAYEARRRVRPGVLKHPELPPGREAAGEREIQIFRSGDSTPASRVSTG
jgi:hypothetical protein